MEEGIRMKVVVIGGSFAGVHCAVRAKELYPNDDIVVIERESELGFIPGGLTLYLNESIHDLDDAHFILAEQVRELGVEVKLETTALSYNFDEKIVHTNNGDVCYDKLVIGTGSSQWSQKLAVEHPALLTYKGKEFAETALTAITNSDTIVIIGGGQTGMELASALIHQGKQVTVIESMGYPIHKYFDEDALYPFLRHLDQKKGLIFRYKETVKELCPKNGLTVVTQKGNYIGDRVILGVNVRPNLEMFEGNLESHSDQTIRVDPYLETSQPDVFAVGDLIQVTDPLIHQSIYLPLINNAVRSGLVCAENLKEKKVPFSGAIRIIGTYVFDYYLASCGLTEEDAFLYDGDVESVLMTRSLSTINPKEVRVKLVYDKQTERLLGAQLVSKYPILEKINTYALAIDTHLTLKELEQKDYFYHPLYANAVNDMTLLDYKGCRFN